MGDSYLNLDTKYLTPAHLSKLLGVSRKTVYGWVYTKRIPYFKICGRLVRFNPDEITKWLSKMKIEPTNKI